MSDMFSELRAFTHTAVDIYRQMFQRPESQALLVEFDTKYPGMLDLGWSPFLRWIIYSKVVADMQNMPSGIDPVMYEAERLEAQVNAKFARDARRAGILNVLKVITFGALTGGLVGAAVAGAGAAASADIARREEAAAKEAQAQVEAEAEVEAEKAAAMVSKIVPVVAVVVLAAVAVIFLAK